MGWTPERREKHRATFNPHLGGGRPKGTKNKNPYPLEAREAKSIQTKAFWAEHPHSWLGKHHSEDTREKISAGRNRFFDAGGKVSGQMKGMFKPKHPEKYAGDSTRIVFRSSWERTFFRYCDDTPGILKWSSEEIIIPYAKPTDGQTHRYFPDVYMEVQTVGGITKKFLIEIKPKMQCLPPKPRKKTHKYLSEAATFMVNQAKWAAAKKYCAARGWTFLVLTEDHLFGK